MKMMELPPKSANSPRRATKLHNNGGAIAKIKPDDPPAIQGPPDELVKRVVYEAVAVRDKYVSIGFLAGQLLYEKKKALGDGAFGEWRNKTFPDVSRQTMWLWAKAAEYILRSISPVAIDIEVSVALISPDEKLSPKALALKQNWFSIAEKKTLRECAASALETEDDRKLDAFAGGIPKTRRGYDELIAGHLKNITNFLRTRGRPGTPAAKYTALTPEQKKAVVSAFVCAVEKMPLWLLDEVGKKIAKERALTEIERLGLR